MQFVVCLCAQITSGTPLVWHLIQYQRQDVFSCVYFLSDCFGSTAKKPSLQLFHARCILLVFLDVRSPQAHLLPSASHFVLFFLFVSVPPSVFVILSCFNPAETFRFAFCHLISLFRSELYVLRRKSGKLQLKRNTRILSFVFVLTFAGKI